MRIKMLSFLMALATVGIGALAAAETGKIRVDGEAWARVPPVMGASGAAYLTLSNSKAMDDVLIAASSPIADRVELHRSVEMDGVMRMIEQEQGIAIPAQSSVELRPGGLHIMLMGLKETPAAGTSFPMTLRFASGQEIQMDVASRAPGATIVPEMGSGMAGEEGKGDHDHSQHH